MFLRLAVGGPCFMAELQNAPMNTATIKPGSRIMKRSLLIAVKVDVAMIVRWIAVAAEVLVAQPRAPSPVPRHRP